MVLHLVAMGSIGVHWDWAILRHPPSRTETWYGHGLLLHGELNGSGSCIMFNVTASLLGIDPSFRSRLSFIPKISSSYQFSGSIEPK